MFGGNAIVIFADQKVVFQTRYGSSGDMKDTKVIVFDKTTDWQNKLAYAMEHAEETIKNMEEEKGKRDTDCKQRDEDTKNKKALLERAQKIGLEI